MRASCLMCIRVQCYPCLESCYFINLLACTHELLSLSRTKSQECFAEGSSNAFDGLLLQPPITAVLASVIACMKLVECCVMDVKLVAFRCSITISL